MRTSFIVALAAAITSTTAAPAFDITELETSKLSPEAHILTKRQFSDSTYNQLTDGTACRAVTVIYARGTNQAGNVGDSSAVGPQFFNNLATSLGGTTNLAIQGVTYTASVGGFLAGGSPAGITTMTNLIVTAATQCPSTKIVLAGYSQGGQLVHSAAQATSATNAAKIAAIVVFGDPKKGQSFGSVPTANTLTICHDNDEICKGEIIITPDHLNYQQDTPTAAAFVAGKV